jgi:hypothetical protein
MFKQIDDLAEYHLYDMVENNRKRKVITENRQEAELWYEAGKIVYEYHTTVYQTDWMVVEQKVGYEWH